MRCGRSTTRSVSGTGLPSRDGPTIPIAHGPEALRRNWLVFRDAWGDFRVDARDLRDFGDRQMSPVTCGPPAREAASASARTWWQAGYSRDGLIARVENYTDREQALEAVGLSEQDAHAGA